MKPIYGIDSLPMIAPLLMPRYVYQCHVAFVSCVARCCLFFAPNVCHAYRPCHQIVHPSAHLAKLLGHVLISSFRS